MIFNDLRVNSCSFVAGKSCAASLKEMRDCQEAPCPIRDCQWAAWDEWSGCSCTCGGGLKRRARTVEVAPRAGGDLCEPSEKSQARDRPRS